MRRAVFSFSLVLALFGALRWNQAQEDDGRESIKLAPENPPPANAASEEAIRNARAAAEEQAAADEEPTAGVWTIDDVKNPESAYYDVESKTLYISSVAGDPDKKDGEGWIGKFGPDGKAIDAHWVKGLDAPKGMDAHDGFLWVSDIDHLVKIDMKSGQSEKVEVPGAQFLNDVAIDAEGTVYVSDMQANKIFHFRLGTVGTFAEGDLEGPNGLVIHGGRLVVAGFGAMGESKDENAPPSFGHVYSLDLVTKEKDLITREPVGKLDGIQLDGSGGHFVSDWANDGNVLRISSEGEIAVVLSKVLGAADLTVIPERELLVVPNMIDNKVTAYDINGLPF